MISRFLVLLTDTATMSKSLIPKKQPSQQQQALHLALLEDTY